MIPIEISRYRRVEEAVSRFHGRYGRLVTIYDRILTVTDDTGARWYQEKLGRRFEITGMSDRRSDAIAIALRNSEYQKVVDLLNDEEKEEGDGEWQFN